MVHLVTAMIIGFTPQSFTRHYRDGKGEAYDVAHLQVLTPKEDAGKKFDVLLNNPVGEKSPWRQTKRRIEFESASEELDKIPQLYLASLKKFRFLRR